MSIPDMSPCSLASARGVSEALSFPSLGSFMYQQNMGPNSYPRTPHLFVPSMYSVLSWRGLNRATFHITV